MNCNLRKSLDQALGIKKMIAINFGVVTELLATEQDLSDELIVFLAEYSNYNAAGMAGLDLVIVNIIEELRVFGDAGYEKELKYTPNEEEVDDEESN